MTDFLHIVYQELPPSANHLYIRGTILTKQAREYKARFKQFVVQTIGMKQIMDMDPKALYHVQLDFYFETVLNKSFGDLSLPPSKRAKSRYKKFDLDNRIKFLSDCVRDSVGIDDSHTFASSQTKHQDPQNPRVEVVVSRIHNIQQFGI